MMMTEEEQIKNAPSKILAGFVVTYRLLGMFSGRAEACMIELMNRRANGDDFKFEDYIEEQLKDAPKPADFKNISNILKMDFSK